MPVASAGAGPALHNDIVLKKIRLENIGCFDRKTIVFSKTAVIFGENRTGKSTLVYAVFFALYGKHLNSHLKVKDLCRKGEASGTVTLYFDRGSTAYKLRRNTEAFPKLFCRTSPDAPWEPISLHDPAALESIIAIPAETASLSSFFRESELIYFLQDMPRYNQTLLQSLIGMDDTLILRSRFKKALGRAREVKKAIENAAPKSPLDPLNLELTRRQLADAEKDLGEIEASRLKTSGEPAFDPTVYKLLRQQHDAKIRNRKALEGLLERYPGRDSLAAEKKALESRMTASENAAAAAEDLQRRLGGAVQKSDHLKRRAAHLDLLGSRPACPVCEQAVSPEQIEAIGRRIAAQLSRAEAERQSLETELSAARRLTAALEQDRKALQEIEKQDAEIQDIERRIQDVDAQISGLSSDLKQFERLTGGVREAEARFGREQSLEQQAARLQEQIIRHRVALKRHEDDRAQAEEHRKHLAAAERKVLVCQVAFQAVEAAIQGLGSRLLEKVRGSVADWSRYFSFLERFDIQITDRELLPMIQAKGYQYKLNQMSKSERIFLYLLLKLAVGDAMGHLGMFMLDDPADGLDRKRKQTLAYLLAEVARRRQILVTTNDAGFCDLFSAGVQVDLQAD